MSKKLLLLSNSTNYGDPYFYHAKPMVVNFLGGHVKEVLFIPYAGVTLTFDEYLQTINEALADTGISFSGIHEYADPVRAVQEAKAIAVGGGNTFKLLQRIYHYELAEFIFKKVNEGTPYIGWSAGSNLACPTIKTTNDMPVVEPPSFNALNLVPFQINPHYTDETIPHHRGETREQRILEFVEENPNVYVVGLPEGNALQIEGKKVKLLGFKKIKVFRKMEEIKVLGQRDYLDFLLE